MSIKVKHVFLTAAVQPPGFSAGQPASGIHAASFDSAAYEIYKVGSEVWIVKDDDAISIPLSAVKRIAYFDLKDTPIPKAREEHAPPRPVGRPKLVRDTAGPE